MPNIKLRTNKRYKRNLKKIIVVNKGIKGDNYLTKWILMPTEILLEFVDNNNYI